MIREHMGAPLDLQTSEDGGALICFTSGTSGPPKGVVISHTALHCQVTPCIMRRLDLEITESSCVQYTCERTWSRCIRGRRQSMLHESCSYSRYIAPAACCGVLTCIQYLL